MTYDSSNRMVRVTTTGMQESYQYAPDNKRVWREKGCGGNGASPSLTLYSVFGQKMGTYCFHSGQTTVLVENMYFGGRLVGRADAGGTFTTFKSDRLMSNQEGGGFFPYGEYRNPNAAQGNEEFATYSRDTDVLDYADQRWYLSGAGRFTTSDPYEASAGPSDPKSWNRYVYTRGDPILRYDPKGLQDEAPPSSPLDGILGLMLFRLRNPLIAELNVPAPLDGVGEVLQESTRNGRSWAVEGLLRINKNCGELSNSLSSGGNIGRALASKINSIKVIKTWNPDQMNALMQNALPFDNYGRPGESVSDWIKGQFGNLADTSSGNVAANFGNIIVITPRGANTIKEQANSLIHEMLHMVIPGGHLAIVQQLGIYKDFSNLGQDVNRANAESDLNSWINKCLGDFK